jgi:riboflavin kinase/FMN adenylyltransferase
VLTIGNFDGVHIGHQQVINRVRDLANGGPSVAITFEPHPVRFFKPRSPFFRITTGAQKHHLIMDAGIQSLVVIEFNKRFTALSPEEFVKEVILNVFQPKIVVVGYDFNFGHNREGTPDLLVRYCKEEGCPVEIHPAFESGGRVVSSTRIRKTITEGRVNEARELLSRPYSLFSRITRGEGRGQKLGFPTANLLGNEQILPANGVYLSLIETNTGVYRSVTNVGSRPTFGGSDVVVETHIWDPVVKQELNLYEEEVVVHFLQALRAEITFDSVEDLRDQITADLEECALRFKEEDISDLSFQLSKNASIEI